MPAIQRHGKSTGQHGPISVKAAIAPNWHVITAAWICLTVASSLTPQSSWAAEPLTASVIRPEAHRVYTSSIKRRIWIAGRSAAPVTAITYQPRFDTPYQDLVEVWVVNHHTVFIDPNADYIHQGEGRIDANHTIPTAQRLYRSLNALPARIITRSDHTPSDPIITPTSTIRPHMIMMKPPQLDQPKDNKKNPGKRQIPTVPGPPKKQPRLMAMATTDDGNL